MNTHRIATMSGWAYPAGVLASVAPDADHFSAQDFFGSSQHPAETFAASLSAPTCLIGWSLGGMLAIEVALTRPEMVSGLILLNSTSRFCNEPGYPCGISLSHLKAIIVGVPMRPEYTLSQFYEFTGVTLDDLTNEELVAQALATGKNLLLDGLRYLHDTDLRERLPEVQCPTLLMHTYDDPVIPADSSRFMATRFRNVDLKVFPGATHASFLQEPVMAQQHIDAFLNEISGVS